MPWQVQCMVPLAELLFYPDWYCVILCTNCFDWLCHKCLVLSTTKSGNVTWLLTITWDTDTKVDNSVDAYTSLLNIIKRICKLINTKVDTILLHISAFHWGITYPISIHLSLIILNSNKAVLGKESQKFLLIILQLIWYWKFI